MDIRLIETIIAGTSFFVLRFVAIKFLTQIQHQYHYSKYRIRPIKKFVNLFILLTLLIVLIAMWRIEQANLLTAISSVLAVAGVALFSEWSILSNI